MHRSRLWTGILLVIAAGVLLSHWVAWAAINPEEFRKGHPECVTIRVVASYLEKSPGLTKVCLAAKVVEVFWTATGLKPGNLILITYQQDHAQLKRKKAAMEKRAKTGWVGPQILYFPPTLKSGDVRVAHLAKVTAENTTGSVYAPQAHQYSFENAVMEWQGPYSSQEELLVQIITSECGNRDSLGWRDLWKKTSSSKAPAIDFDKYVVACVFLGQRLTGGYWVEFGKPYIKDNRMVIPYKEHKPTGFVTQALSYPYRLKAFERPNGREVVLEEIQ